MKSKKTIKVFLLVMVVLVLTVAIANKFYDSKFDAHRSRSAVFEYNGYDYIRLERFDGYYIWDNINNKIGNIRPPFVDAILGDEWKMYDFADDNDNLFLAVKTKNMLGYFHVCYRSDIALPEISVNNIKALEIIPGAEDDKYKEGGLFNNDFTMNDVKPVYTVTDEPLIKRVISDCEEESQLGLSYDDFNGVLSEDEEYYVIATFDDAPESLCFLVGIMKADNEKVTLEYTRTPFSTDSIFYW